MKMYCNIAILQYCTSNTSILFTERKPIIHKFDFAYLGIYWKTFVPKSLSRDFNRFVTEFWWYLQASPIFQFNWNQKTVSFFKVLHFNTLQLFAILQYCNTTFLKSNAILQKSRKSIAILKCNTAILQYWKSGSDRSEIQVRIISTLLF